MKTFTQFIVDRYSMEFYRLSLIDMARVMENGNKVITLEEWFSNLYTDYKILYYDRK